MCCFIKPISDDSTTNITLLAGEYSQYMYLKGYPTSLGTRLTIVFITDSLPITASNALLTPTRRDDDYSTNRDDGRYNRAAVSAHGSFNATACTNCSLHNSSDWVEDARRALGVR